MLSKFLKSALLLLVLILFSGCPTPVSSDTEVDDSDITDIDVETDTTLYDFDSDYDGIFATNDSDVVDEGGATYWVVKEEASDSFSTVEVTVEKTSGYNSGGYGVIFAQEDSGTEDFSCLVLMINISGQYCVGLVSDSVFEFIEEWTYFDYLTQGYSQENTLRVEEDEEAGSFLIYINDSLAYDFEDPSTEPHTGGGHGYITVVTPLEDFPNDPVRVYFKEAE
ncbi:MAG: hypothetical protein PQJ59_09685 [Spirochaetales bacterium]|nr:hypothetical protein [Spirochaetales bacterium]